MKTIQALALRSTVSVVALARWHWAKCSDPGRQKNDGIRPEGFMSSPSRARSTMNGSLSRG
jgi:hypothetical protein